MVCRVSVQRIWDAFLWISLFNDGGQVAQHPLAQLLRRHERLRDREAAPADVVLQLRQPLAQGRVLFREAGMLFRIGRVTEVEKGMLVHIRIKQDPMEYLEGGHGLMEVLPEP